MASKKKGLEVTLACRVDDEFAQKVEAARGKQPKSEFFREPIQAKISGQPTELPAPESDKPLTALIHEFLDAIYRRKWNETAEGSLNETEALVNMLRSYVDNGPEIDASDLLDEAQEIVDEQKREVARRKLEEGMRRESARSRKKAG